jgi:hypothetical protein
MNYNFSKINGISYKELNSTIPQTRLTKSQISLILNEITKQMFGYGKLPQYNKNLIPEQNWKFAIEFDENYWNFDIPGEPVKKR